MDSSGRILEVCCSASVRGVGRGGRHGSTSAARIKDTISDNEAADLRGLEQSQHPKIGLHFEVKSEA